MYVLVYMVCLNITEAHNVWQTLHDMIKLVFGEVRINNFTQTHNLSAINLQLAILYPTHST